MADLVYGSEHEKFERHRHEVAELHAVGQPVLGGYRFGRRLRAPVFLAQTQRRPHEVLNARQNQREAEIVAEAGQLGSVTIATNMAGRGTDIKLGNTPFKKLLKHWKIMSWCPQTHEGRQRRIG